MNNRKVINISHYNSSLLFLCSPKEKKQKERAFAAVEKNPVHNARQLAERRYPLRSHPSCLRPGFPSFGEIQTSLYSALTIGKRSAPLPCYVRRIFFITPHVSDMTLTTREIQRLQQWQDATLSSEVPPCNLLFSFLCFVSFFFSGRRKKERNEGKNFYYHMNHLGSTAFVTDQNQNVTQGFLYAPFGEITTEFAPLWQNGTLPKYSFNAKELDEETGMYYYEARYYKPPVFTSRDPMMDQKPWLSPYHYCSNNPVGRVDISGNKDRPFNRERDKKITPMNGTETPIKYGYNKKGKLVFSAESIKNTYNCHSYAWNNSKGDPTPAIRDRPEINGSVLKRWDNNPADDIIEQKARQLDPDEDNVVGDKVIYYIDRNGNGKYDDGEYISHSAVVTKVDEEGYTTEVTGKMGDGPISTNHPAAPGYYEEDSEYENGPKEKLKRAYFRIPTTSIPEE